MGRRRQVKQDINTIVVEGEGRIKIPHQEGDLLQIAAGTLIRQCRRELALTGKQLGDRIGMSQQHVLRYERGDTELPLSKVNLFATALGLTFPQFINELFRVVYVQDAGSHDISP